MAEPGLAARIAGRLAYEFTLMQPMLPTYAHLLVSALFPIYAGAHASLSRPSSAAKPKKCSSKKARTHDDASDDDDEEETRKMEGMSPNDALVMPLFAGCTLAGLYYLLKWLQDPTLLNKLLNAYFSLFGVFSVGRLITDALDIGHSIIFPRRFALDGALYHVRGADKAAIPVAGNTQGKQPRTSPLPGFLARIPLSEGLREWLWSDREMPHKKWTARVYLHRVFAGKALVGAHGLAGFTLALAAVAYFNLVDKPWYLTNLMGFGFSYGALQLMSPTTFATGSLILMALFFYDIYFVFFTPMMVTVATKLDVPIKLVFPRPTPPGSTKSMHAMLGLGDVVLPGIMIGLALRFDLFLFYLRRQKYTPSSTDPDAPPTIEKPRYFPLAGRWSDHFWTHSLSGRPLFSTFAEKGKEEADQKGEAPFTFPKTYFYASLVGYVAGMLATLGVMHLWGHAQPALLYLVPGVLGSVWGTALVRGELPLMWNFSEAVEDEEPVKAATSESSTGDGDAKNDTKTPGRTSFFSLSKEKAEEREARWQKNISKHVSVEFADEDNKDRKKEEEEKDGVDGRVKEVAEHRSEREVFSFSIEAPWTLKQPRSVKKGLGSARKEKDVDVKLKEEEEEEEEKPNWAPPVSEKKAGEAEPAGKRIRLK